MIDVNVVGTFHLIKAALPGMKNRSGRGAASITMNYDVLPSWSGVHSYLFDYIEISYFYAGCVGI